MVEFVKWLEMTIIIVTAHMCLYSIEYAQGSHSQKKVRKNGRKVRKMKIDKKSEKIVKKSENFDNFSNLSIV